jgi:cbb3-type cytochrome oxidase maturation protein
VNILLVLIPLSLVLVAIAGWAFFWSVDNAQFDDLDTPALMPLAEDVPIAPATRVESIDGLAATSASPLPDGEVGTRSAPREGTATERRSGRPINR